MGRPLDTQRWWMWALAGLAWLAAPGLAAPAIDRAPESAANPASRLAPANASASIAGPGRLEHLRAARFDRFVVGFADAGDSLRPAQRELLDRVGAAFGLSVRDAHRTVGGMQVVRASRALDDRRAQQFMNRLRREPGVAYVARDGRLQASMQPNDPLYAQQWNLKTGQTGLGGMRLPQAWDRASGDGVVVAVLDTGITSHPDLDAHVLPGRDFITDLDTAGDGDGRDANPADEGDWSVDGQCEPGSIGRPSSWHGTHMAGIVAALTDNGTGIAGVAPQARVQPLRVLGHCGGWSTDVADAILWAAGGTVPGLPANPTPADVVNLSLSGDEPCIAPLQAAIDYANAQGVVVVASAGNSAADARGFAPANCKGLVVVGATDGYGEVAWYSNFGPDVDVSAPGGSAGSTILSTNNAGSTTVGVPNYLGFTGTSPAAAEVSGLAALMQSVAPTTPDNVEAILAGTTQPFLVPCAPGVCGTGIVDAPAAVAAAIDGALSVTDVRILEGNQGNALATFEVRLSRPMAQPVSFDLATANGSNPAGAAMAGSDFQALSLPGQVFPPGTTSRKYSVVVYGDAVPEPDEIFFVKLTNIQGVAAGRATGDIMLVNDDAIPLVSGQVLGPVTSLVRDTFTLYSIEVPPGATSLSFAWTFTGGELSMFARHGAPPIADQDNDCWIEDWWGGSDCTFENPEAGTWYLLLQSNLYLELSLTASYLAAAPPVLTLGDATVAEGQAGTRTLAFPVRLSKPAVADVSFLATTWDGTAVAGSDYQALDSQPVTIPAGQGSTQVEVTVFGDTEVEANESLALELTAVQGASVARSRAQGRIANDDLAVLSIGDIQVAEANEDTTIAFELRLSAPMPSPVSFDIRTVEGSAHAGSDFVARRLTGRYMDAGRTRQVFEVTLRGDQLPEPTETFQAVLENVAGATLGKAQGTATVADDDGAASPARKAAAAAVSPAATPRNRRRSPRL